MSWTLPYFDYLVTYGGISHIGRVREKNEDAWVVESAYGLFAVADGVGGNAAGEVASRHAVQRVAVPLATPAAQETLRGYLKNPVMSNRASVFALLKEGVSLANGEIRARQKANFMERGMACTLDVALLLGSHAFILHAGDSRVYLARSATMMQLTTDHTLHAGLLAHGAMTPSEPPRGASRLTNGVGMRDEVKVDEVFADLTTGDRLLLCSDGVSGEVPGEKEMGELARKGRPEEAVVELINGALEQGGRDNATAVLIEVGQRRVNRPTLDHGQAAQDLMLASHSPLLMGVEQQLVTLALQSAIEVKFSAGATLPRNDASDRVAYIVLSGSVSELGGVPGVAR
jgi:PPM family protein phosphatase